MDRAQLIHVVGLVGTAARVHEGEMSRDEQRGLVVRYRERPGEDCAGLSVFTLAIGEEQRIGSTVTMAEMASLADEAAGHRSAVRNMGAAADDEIVRDHAMSDLDRRGLITVHAAVPEAVHTADEGIIPDPNTVQVTGIADEDVAADGADGRFLRLRIRFDHPVQRFHQFGTVPVHRHHIGDLRAEAVVNEHFPAARLVQDRNGNTVAETAGAVRQDEVHVLQDRIVTDFIIRNIVGDALDEAVVTDRHVMERRIADARVFPESAGELEIPFELSESDRTGKAHAADMVHLFPSARQHVSPILRLTAGGLKFFDFLLSKIPVSHSQVIWFPVYNS